MPESALHLTPPDVCAIRAESKQTLITRWKPVDLICRQGEDELTVRTKLVRNELSAAVCVSESVSHALLSALGFRMAKPFTVNVGDEFARDLTAQYDFEDQVQSGKHWGTKFMRRGVQEVEFSSDIVEDLANPEDLFRLYLADVILGNRDRATFGNVLLGSNSKHPSKFDLIPIDQSDAFFHPSSINQPSQLRSRINEPSRVLLDGTERVLVEHGTDLVHECFAETFALRGRASEFVGSSHVEWINRAGANPDVLCEFLEHRINTLTELAQKDHWLGVASIDMEGQYVLDLS